MTKKRLEELKQKFQTNEGNIQDLSEILIELFFSFSEHMKDFKKQINEIQDAQAIIYTELEKLNNPVYTIIENYSDDFEDSFEENIKVKQLEL